jgi:transposase
MEDTTRYFGCDVHKETLVIAIAQPGREQAHAIHRLSNSPESVRRFFTRAKRQGDLSVVYEAGPCGYALYRQLTRMGIACQVAAPSLLLAAPGDRVKTDRRDAVRLAEALRAGQISPVRVPDETAEALRDLSRARGTARQDVTRIRHRISKLLLRLDQRPPTRMTPWTQRYRRWLERVDLGHPALETVLAEGLVQLAEAEARLARLERALTRALAESEHAALVGAYMAMRGIDQVTAAVLVTELGDLTRFTTPAQLMAYVGLTPSEYSSGARRRQGRITRTGNSRARHVAVEASWHYRYPPRRSARLAARQVAVAPEIVAIAWKAQHRLHQRYRDLHGRGKPRGVVIVAMARELLGFLWAIAWQVRRLAEGEQALELAATGD